MRLRDVLGASVPVKVLEYALESPNSDFTKKDIITNKDVSFPTLNKYWNCLIEAGIIEETRVVGNAKLYRLTKNPIVKEINRVLLLLQ